MQDYYKSGVPSTFNFEAHVKIPNYVKDSSSRVWMSDFPLFVEGWNRAIRTRNPDAIDAPLIVNHDSNRLAAEIETQAFVPVSPVLLKMAASMLIFMPGNPFIYYGEELGMTGKKTGGGVDENVRGPMRWGGAGGAGTDPRGPTTNNWAYWEGPTVSAQLGDPDSVLRFYIDALNLKNQYPGINSGKAEMINNNSYSTQFTSMYKVVTNTGPNLAIVHNFGHYDEQWVTPPPGAVKVGGFVRADKSAYAMQQGDPRIEGGYLKLPLNSTAIIELSN
jgi:alpha-amylase